MTGPATIVHAPMERPTLTTLYHRVALVLRVGVGLSLILFLLAAAAAVWAGGSGLLTPTIPLTPSSVGASLAARSAEGLALLGAAVLTATPLLRVVLSFQFFVSRGDRDFALITGFSFTLLMLTVVVGILY